MKDAVIQFFIGLCFGAGLVISGMANPAKVLNFLDFAGIADGSWDPSLLCVLVSAIGVTAIGFRLAFKHGRPLLGGKFNLPAATDIDQRIIVGPIIFGLGWGLVGLCPGPALTALGIAPRAVAAFVLMMLVGMAIARWIASRRP